MSRLSAITHSPPEILGPGSKERKSVLINLADGLDLHVDHTNTKPELGASIASALNMPWDESCWSAGQTITLEGLNRLLQGAESAMGGREPLQLRLFARTGGVATNFAPARSKLEAVSRLSAITHSPPEILGPGSKERKSVLINLADGLDLHVDHTNTKPELGASIASALNMPWDESCWSAGQTITLEGLNRLLQGAEVRRRPADPHRGMFRSAQDEARGILTTLATTLPRRWDGRQCVEEMYQAGYSQWAQDEWAAFYFEYIGLPALINSFGGGPRLIGSTRFDYGLAHTWDLKVHLAHAGQAPLNDQASIKLAAAKGGVGFIVLSGEVEYDDGEFRLWQKEYRATRGKRARPRARPPKYKRRSKPAFHPAMVEAFYFSSPTSLQDALETGILTEMRQGTQPDGRPRRSKLTLSLVKARWTDALVTQVPLSAAGQDLGLLP